MVILVIHTRQGSADTDFNRFTTNSAWKHDHINHSKTGTNSSKFKNNIERKISMSARSGIAQMEMLISIRMKKSITSVLNQVVEEESPKQIKRKKLKTNAVAPSSILTTKTNEYLNDILRNINQ
jgi:hypothetical protein